MTRLSATGVAARLRGTDILHGVDLPPLAPGEVLGLIGPNAAGKSTLLRRLSGEIDGGGAIRLDGADRASLPLSQWRRQVAYMPQTPPQASSLTPYELIQSAVRSVAPERTAREISTEIERLLARLNLVDQAFAPLNALSGGKRQLVGFALALAVRPRLLLLDEPTSALDLRWRLALLAELRRVADEGAAAIVALHDLDLAARFCDRLALLHHGRLIRAGTPEEVLTADAIAAAYQVTAKIDRDEDGGLIVRALAPLTEGETHAHRP